MTIQPLLRARPDSEWARRLTHPGWLLLPLRVFLGATFTYAGLQKLADPAYLDPHSPTSVANQMRLLRHSSPIGGLLGASTHAPTLVGLLIAFGELAVGIGTLVGLYLRFAAVGGALLALSFYLTVSWNTTPYYYGSDIVFVFAWLTMLAFGDTGVLSVQTWVAQRARRPPPRVRGVRRPTAAELDRRAVVQTAIAGALLGAATLAIGAITAGIGRAVGGHPRAAAQLEPLGPVAGPNAVTAPVKSSPASPASRKASPVHARRSSASPSPSPSRRTAERRASPRPAPASSSAPGTLIGTTAAVPVGQARSFTDPQSGNPAWIVHPGGNTFVAFSATCTHAGCPVQYDASNVQFVCPCHGGVYDARTGSVLQGPPPSPLPSIPVYVIGNQLRVGR